MDVVVHNVRWPQVCFRPSLSVLFLMQVTAMLGALFELHIYIYMAMWAYLLQQALCV